MQDFLDELFTSDNIVGYFTGKESTMYPLEQFFPQRVISGLRTRSVMGARNVPIILRPASLEESSHFRQRENLKMDEKEVIYYKDGYQIGTEEAIRLEELKEKSSLDPSVKEVFDSIYDDTNKLIEGARATHEFLRAQVMCNGAILVDDAGVKKTVDYNLEADQKFTAPVAWSDPAAKILDDINLNRRRAKKRGEIVNVAMCNDVLMEWLLKNKQVQDAAKALISGNGEVVMGEDIVKKVIAANCKVLLLENESMYKTSDGTTEKFWEDNKFTLFSAEALPGKSCVGPTGNKLLVGKKGHDAVAINDGESFLYVFWEGNPPKRKAIIDTNMIPSLEGGNTLQIMTVL